MPRLPIRHCAAAAAFALTLTGCFGESDLTQTTGSAPISGPGDVGSPGEEEIDACANVVIDPGRVTLHRLNRAEYNNTVRDLFGDTTAPAKDFPADDHGYGFDNNADVLSLAPLLMEKYEAAAEKLVEAAWTRDFKPGQQTRIEAETATTTTGSASGNAWNLYSNGSAYASITFVADGTYTFKVRAWGKQAGSEPVKMDLLLDNAVIASFDVTATSDAPQIYSASRAVTAGAHKVEVAFTNDY
ncbi:MAG: DUF1587 domain-containing protein [Myxococcaceae bacterium]|nr:DUF1587 domain-containing protein [Myxococcaceae bacterium]